MAKIAVLIVGEYRTFAHCRKTQQFLDQPDVDVYLHTWNITNMKNPVRAHTPGWSEYVPENRVITIEEVKLAVGRPCFITLATPPVPGSNPMIEGWLKGMEMVKQTEREYDYMFVMRPDLFFQPGAFIIPDYFPLYKNSIGTNLPSEEDPTCLDDTCFFSTYENIQKIITPALRDIPWLGHHQWHEHITSKVGLGLTRLPISSYSVIARNPINDNMTWDEVNENWLRWYEHGE